MKKMIRVLAMALCLMMLAMPVLSHAEEEEAPNVTELLKTYTKLDLTPYLGKTVLVNFFTEWCAYCMQEMPDIRALTDIYDEDSLQVVLVHPWSGEDATNTENVKKRFQMEHMEFFEDEDLLVSSFIGVPGYPTSLFVAPDGTLVGAAPFMLTLDQLTYQLDQMGVERKAAEE